MQKSDIVMCCPSLQDKTCGIANYTRQLASALTEQKQNVVSIEATEFLWSDAIFQLKPKVFHLQLEYQWFSPERIRVAARSARRVGAKFICTLHSFSSEPYAHNDAVFSSADSVVAHSDVIYHQLPDAWKKKFCQVIMGVPDVKCSTTSKFHTGIGFFGVCYFHKGVDRLIQAHALMKTEVPLLILSQPPKQNQSYYEFCKLRAQLSPKSHLIIWETQYQEEQTIVEKLERCELIALPYREFGTIGTSLAARTALNTERPLFVSKTSQFSDLQLNTFTDSDSVECLAEELDMYLKLIRENEKPFIATGQDRRRWNTWQRAADQHIQTLYRQE
jgi:glycosyltransferase involved in cell wall biosynthesis